MKFVTKTLVLGLIMAGGIALAQSKAADPDVNARQTLMQGIGGSLGAIGGMVKGEVAFDAAAAEAAKATLVANAGMIAEKFKNNAADPASKAKAEIWTNWDDFVADADALAAAASALDATSLDGLKAGMGAIGGACKDCHSSYRS
jgi:cytochrome c556